MQNTTLENYLIDLKKARPKDLLLQRTSVGIHKDEIEIEMNALPFKQIASQGQKKSMLFALKLASFQMLKSKNGFEPVLLLDDIFEKLDAFRLEQLMDWVCKKNKGQVFMTDTHPDRMSNILEDLSLPFQTIKL